MIKRQSFETEEGFKVQFGIGSKLFKFLKLVLVGTSSHIHITANGIGIALTDLYECETSPGKFGRFLKDEYQSMVSPIRAMYSETYCTVSELLQ